MVCCAGCALTACLCFFHMFCMCRELVFVTLEEDHRLLHHHVAERHEDEYNSFPSCLPVCCWCFLSHVMGLFLTFLLVLCFAWSTTRAKEKTLV